MFNTNFVFTPGKLTVTLDGGAGSSGKGKLGSFLCEHASNWQFACNTFMPQSGHWVRLDDKREFFYQTFNSCAYLADRYEMLYIAPGATIDLSAFWAELEQNKIPRKKIRISPATAILQNIDMGYERGTCDLGGQPIPDPVRGGPLVATGSTRKGCGVNRARRALRHEKAKYAADVPELREFLCDVPSEIMDRLDQGQSGLLEIAQGFQLSYLLPAMGRHTTSRNCTVAAGLDDLMVPPYYVGNLVLNFRTYPIRIHSNVYEDKPTRKAMTWDEVTGRVRAAGENCPISKKLLESVGIDMVEGNSGPAYPDQRELTWEELNALIGSPEVVSELTSVTKLPRRIFSFSRQNVAEAIRHNRINGELYLSLNFANYVDHTLAGMRGRGLEVVPSTNKLSPWLKENLAGHLDRLRFIGTGPKTDDMIQLG